MNHIAELIEDCYRDAGYDEGYICSKVSKMKHDESKYHTLALRASNLDVQNRERLAHKMDVDPNELSFVLDFLAQRV
ncbi:hypothetical protein AB4292_12180 [Vibrio cyclitrophicus]|uniref:hypothetical protein n=1 Tax=Vibrio atlanticus TaxID=693153 RepID=UPI00354F11FE